MAVGRRAVAKARYTEIVVVASWIGTVDPNLRHSSAYALENCEFQVESTYLRPDICRANVADVFQTTYDPTLFVEDG
jgi:hypothetical protein